MKTIHKPTILRKAQLAGILEVVCQNLELSPSQRQCAENRYLAIGGWLSEAEETLLERAQIYAQGSIALQTTVKPVGRDEFDLDLVCLVPGFERAYSPAELKALIGNRLKAHGHYRSILEEKARCWRINYANEFHLDITPSIPNPACTNGGELVPDKKLRTWQASNPRGYRDWFERHAAVQPRLLTDDPGFSDLRADIEALPGQSQIKGVLRRTVQICKRHRDLYFDPRHSDLSPISIIITTLAARSYLACVQAATHDTDLDLLLAVVRAMPSFVEISRTGGRELFFVWNETTQAENFAEKWNEDQRLAKAFFEWQQQVVLDLASLTEIEGLDRLQEELSGWVGSRVAGAAVGSLTASVGTSRELGDLAVTQGVGLSIGASRGPFIKPNTFYGA